jgi:hypothetical protein
VVGTNVGIGKVMVDVGVGYHNKGYPTQSNEKTQRNVLTTIIRASDASSDSPDPSGHRTQVPTRPTPQGLGRKFRLARPLRASDASSDSPDPSGHRTQVPTRPTPQGIGREFRLARPLRASDASSDSPDPVQARAPDPTPPGQQDFHRTAPVPTT